MDISLELQKLNQLLTSQSERIIGLEHQLSQKASRTELNSGLNIKSNITEVMKSIEEIKNTVSYEKLKEIFIDRREIEILINSKINKTHTLYDEISNLKLELDGKVSVEEVNSILSTKANKASVIEAMHKKVNKSELEEIQLKLTQIEETQINQTSQMTLMKKLVDEMDMFKKDSNEKILNMKKDLGLISSLSNELSIYKSNISSDMSSISINLNTLMNEHSSMKKFSNDQEQKIQKIDKDIDIFLSNIKNDFIKITNSLNSKMDKTEMMAFNEKLEKYDSALLINEKIGNSYMKSLEYEMEKMKIQMKDEREGMTLRIKEVHGLCNVNSEGIKELKLENYTINERLNGINVVNEEINETNKKINKLKTSLEFLNENSKRKDIVFDEIINEIETLRKEAKAESDSLFTSLNRKVETKDFDMYSNIINGLIDEIKRSVHEEKEILKGIQPLKLVLQQKADIEEVNKALSGIYNEIDMKIGLTDFNSEFEKIYSVMDDMNKVIIKEKEKEKEKEKNKEEIVNKINQLCNINENINALSISQYECVLVNNNYTESGYVLSFTEKINTLKSDFIFDKAKRTYIEIDNISLLKINLFLISSSPIEDLYSIFNFDILINGDIFNSLPSDHMKEEGQFTYSFYFYVQFEKVKRNKVGLFVSSKRKVDSKVIENNDKIKNSLNIYDINDRFSSLSNSLNSKYLNMSTDRKEMSTNNIKLVLRMEKICN